MLSFLVYISLGLKCWSVNYSSIYEKYGLKVFKHTKFVGEISNNWPNNLLGTNLYKTLESCW